MSINAQIQSLKNAVGDCQQDKAKKGDYVVLGVKHSSAVYANAEMARLHRDTAGHTVTFHLAVAASCDKTGLVKQARICGNNYVQKLEHIGLGTTTWTLSAQPQQWAALLAATFKSVSDNDYNKLSDIKAALRAFEATP